MYFEKGFIGFWRKRTYNIPFLISLSADRNGQTGIFLRTETIILGRFIITAKIIRGKKQKGTFEFYGFFLPGRTVHNNDFPRYNTYM